MAGHFGNLLGALFGGNTPLIGTSLGGVLGAGLGGGAGGAIGSAIGGGLGGLFGSGPGGGPGGGGGSSERVSPLNEAAVMLKDAARQLSDAVTQMSGQGPAAGSSLSSHKWINNLQGTPQLFGPGNMPPTATAAPVEGAGAGTAGGAALAGPIGLIVLGAALAIKEGGEKLVTVFNDLRDPAAMLSQYVAPFVSQVSKFNPASIERMNFAFDNLSASAGRFFEPIITEATAFADELNTIYTSVGPDIRAFVADTLPPLRDFGREFTVGFVGMIRDGANELRPLLSDLAPLGRAAGLSFKAIFEAGVPLVKALDAVSGVFNPFRSSTEGAVSGLKEMAVQTIVFAGMVRDASNNISNVIDRLNPASYLPASSLTEFLKPLMGSSTLSLLAGGQSVAQRTAAARDLVNAPSTPLSGPMTYAAQPARQVGIEDVGMEARRQAFSMGASAAESTATNTQQTAANTLALLTYLRTVFPQFAVQLTAAQIAGAQGG